MMDSSNMEDLRLPNTVVARLIKDAIPAGILVSKEARTAIARSAAIFVVHATAYANEYAVAHKRKNVTAADVFHAVKALECDELEKPMAEAMKHYKIQNEQRKKRKYAAAAARRSNARATASLNANANSAIDNDEDHVEENENDDDDGDISRNSDSSEADVSNPEATDEAIAESDEDE